MNLGENIKSLRIKRGVTQKELSNELGYSCQNISKWETGSSMPDVATVAALANFFGVSVDYLLGKDGTVTADDGEIITLPRQKKDQTITLHADINENGPFTVWTDFEYNGTKAPDSVFFEGRHRTSEPRWSFPAYGANIFILAVNSVGKIANAFYMLNAVRHELGFVMSYYYSADEKYACITPTKEATMPDWLTQMKYEFLIPKDGYLLVANLNGLRAETLMKFIVPKHMHNLFPATVPMEVQRRFGVRFDNGCILRECFAPNDLDDIDVRLENGSLIFTRPVDVVEIEENEPPTPAAEQIAEGVVRYIEEKYGIDIVTLAEKLNEWSERLDTLEGILEDNESRIDELEGILEDNESRIDELEGMVEDCESRIDDLE